MKDYTFVKPETEEDYEALYSVMDSAFGDEDVRGITKRFVEHHPEINREHFFMVKHGDSAVAGLLLIPQVWKIGGAEIKVAEMGCVGTDPVYRRKGVQCILNDEFDKYAAEQGFDLCVLAGIPYFYRQFGYQYAVELEYSTEIELAKIPDRESGIRLEEFMNEHIMKADRLLRKAQEGYLVHSVRTEGVWEMQQEIGTYGGEPFQAASLYLRDRFVGYYRYVVDKEKGSFYIKELGIDENVSVGDLAGVIKGHASGIGMTVLKTGLPHQDQVSKYLISLEAKTNRPYAWQVKTLDLTRFLTKLSLVLESRIEDSEFKGVSKDITLNFWKFAVSMKIEGGKIGSIEKVHGEKDRTIGLNPYAFIKLALGYKSRLELEEMYPDFRVRGEMGGLIDVMFPKQSGYIHYCY